MSIMYCSQCKRNVETTIKDINIVLAVLLAIFTGGIGLLIYVAIYLEKKHKCIHCNSVCKAKTMTNHPVSNYQLISLSNQNQYQETVVGTQLTAIKGKFCYNCGTELDVREVANFCPLCGSSNSE
ncbi:hypothetical protein LCGC14_0496340 [marine sediment metagenome]|uniref:Zinc-ribbon domain-containing protein n=1 Tax=marine sediment metagenome TaxID=412755 RepID=A0A0F9SNQ2_9ZZZZ|nr:MAG: Double zinc ribbon [Candidatus Lokiarchaeum sp. GC14_75]